MNILSQNDPRWKNIRLGSCNSTIGSDGCAITCIAMLADTTPDQVNAKFPYIQGCLLNWSTAASQWGLKVNSPVFSLTPTSYPTIAHVTLSDYDHYVVVDSQGNQYDPWDGKIKRTYKLIDYRNITKGDEMTDADIIKRDEILSSRIDDESKARAIERGVDRNERIINDGTLSVRIDNLVTGLQKVTDELAKDDTDFESIKTQITDLIKVDEDLKSKQSITQFDEPSKNILQWLADIIKFWKK